MSNSQTDTIILRSAEHTGTLTLPALTLTCLLNTGASLEYHRQPKING